MSTNAHVPSNPDRLQGQPGRDATRRIMRLQPGVVHDLPGERAIRIEINGCHAGTIVAVPDALPELALGWAMMHGFLQPDAEPDRLTIAGDRVSIMVTSDVDVDHQRLRAAGWTDDEPTLPVAATRRDPVVVTEPDLIALVDAAWDAFRHDDGGDGFQQAAVASTRNVLCIARDRTPDLAAAKVLGWLMGDGREAGASIMLVRGMVGRRLVEAGACAGLELVVASGLPTAEAWRAAQDLPVSLVGLATARTLGLLVDNGHLCEA